MEKLLKVWFWNRAGELKRLICDCGCDKWSGIAFSDENGDVFECGNCGEYSRRLREYRSERKEEE